MKKRTLFLFFALGFFSLVAQTLIIREFVVSFGGNELGIGLFYFFWFFWVGIGAKIVSPPRGRFLFKHFYKLAAAYPPAAFLQIILFIALRQAAGVHWWEFFSSQKVIFCLFAFTSLLSLATGAIFTLGVRRRREEGEGAGLIATVYIYEALGSFAAGGVVTFFIVKLLPPVVILLVTALFFYFAVIAAAGRKEKSAVFLSGLFVLFLCLGLLNHQPLVGFFHSLRMKNTLAAASFLREVYTPYQHLLIGRVGEQTVVSSNGQIVASFPDEVSADEESALFLAQAHSPSRILICGGTAHNLIASLLKFPVTSVTYCLSDKVFYDAVRGYLPAAERRRLDDPRLKVVFGPAQEFLRDNLKRGRHTRQDFDLVVVYAGDPDNLAAGSFFTREFYALARENMKATGVFAARITSAENFIGEEISNYGASVYYTLGEVFSKIVVTPGRMNWFFAGDRNAPLTPDAAVLEARFKKIVPRRFAFSPVGFRSMLDARRVDFVKNAYVNNALFRGRVFINEARRPLTFFLNLLVMARHAPSYFLDFFKAALRAGPGIFVVPLVIFFLARLHFLFRGGAPAASRRLFNSKLFQFFSAFLGFSFHLALIFLFQNKFGTIFQLIGLVNALFMLGLCCGAAGSRAAVARARAQNVVVSVLFIETLCFLAALPLLTLPSGGGTFLLFMVFFLLAGMLTGSSYPLAAKIMETSQVSVGAAAANLVLLDYWGGALAGLLAGVLMFPLLGMVKMLGVLCVICVILNLLFIREFIAADEPVRRERAVLSFPYTRTSYFLAAVSLVFFINGYFLRPYTLPAAAKGEAVPGCCQAREEPFPAQVCLTEEGKEYILESKDFASGIKGFGGRINLRLRVDEGGRIKEVKVTEHQETSAYISGIDDFLAQFRGRGLREEFSRGNVDVISGATATSQAAIDIINEVARKLKGKLTGLAAAEGLTGAGVHRRSLFVDAASIYLIVFTVLAVAGFMFPAARRWRKIHLILVVLFSGVFFNLTFSFSHLANLMRFNVPAPRSSLLLIYFIPLGLGVFLGPLWCGWLCPFGALQELIGGRADRKGPVSRELTRRARYFKYVFLAVFIVVISFPAGAHLFRQEPLSVFFLHPFKLSGDKILSFVVLFFSFFFFRFWCRYFCAVGAFFSLFNKFALFKKFFPKQYRRCCCGVEHPQDIDCIQCNLCRQDRRQKESGNGP